MQPGVAHALAIRTISTGRRPALSSEWGLDYHSSSRNTVPSSLSIIGRFTQLTSTPVLSPVPQSNPVPTTTPARTAVYTGSFDPITLGHLDVIDRASRIFDSIIIGIGVNPDKQAMFSLEERVSLVQTSVAHLHNVSVELFSGLSVAFVREQGGRVLLRGVRSLTDIEAEFTMTLANRKLDPTVETVFLMADSQYSHISSSLLKQITPLAGDEALRQFVPAPVVRALREKLAKQSPS